MGVLFASKEGPLIMLKSMIVIAFIVVAAVALPTWDDEVVPEEELVGATCTCCGKTVSKPSCSITLYQHRNYGGYGINLAPGSYNMNTLIAKGMKNDDLSSVRIHGSCRAILYQHINFGGASMTKDSDDSCFTNDRMAIPVSQLHQLVVTERPKMPEDDEVDEVDTNGRRLLGRRAVSWNDQISSAKVQDRQAAAHSCTAVCKAPCAQEKAEKAAAAEKAAKAAEKKKKAEEKASKEAATKKEKDAKEKAAKAKAEKDKKEKDAKKEAAEKAAEKAKKKEMGEKAKEKAAKAAEKKAKAAAEAADKKKKEQAEKEKADKAAAAAEKKSKIPPADPCKKYKAQEAANKKLTKTLQKSIRFEPNQTILTAAGKKTLDDVAAVVIKYAWMELDLTGQSTASGSGCQRLVDGRAKAASAYLKNKGCTNK